MDVGGDPASRSRKNITFFPDPSSFLAAMPRKLALREVEKRKGKTGERASR